MSTDVTDTPIELQPEFYTKLASALLICGKCQQPSVTRYCNKCLPVRDEILTPLDEEWHFQKY